MHYPHGSAFLSSATFGAWEEGGHADPGGLRRRLTSYAASRLCAAPVRRSPATRPSGTSPDRLPRRSGHASRVTRHAFRVPRNRSVPLYLGDRNFRLHDLAAYPSVVHRVTSQNGRALARSAFRRALCPARAQRSPCARRCTLRGGTRRRGQPRRAGTAVPCPYRTERPGIQAHCIRLICRHSRTAWLPCLREGFRALRIRASGLFRISGFVLRI